MDGVQGWRNQRTPSPVYFIIHCIAKLQNIFPLTSLKPSSISKGILSKEAFGQGGFRDHLSMIEQLPCSLLVLHSCIYFVPERSANKILKSCCSCHCLGALQVAENRDDRVLGGFRQYG